MPVTGCTVPEFTEFKIKVVTPEEHRAELQKEIKYDGLKKSVTKRCEEIDEMCAGTGYLFHRGVQELLCEIEELIDAYADVIKERKQEWMMD